MRESSRVSSLGRKSPVDRLDWWSTFDKLCMWQTAEAQRRIKGDRSMAGKLVECSFFIPLTRDANLSDGAAHPAEAWQWLDNELFIRFQGRTIAPGEYQGFYRDPDTRQQVGDNSRRYIVAVPSQELDGLRSVLAGACVIFAQKCIYFSVGGQVEFVEVKSSK
jgi:hypothetical protein